jgi:hypothetical protein
LSLVDADDLGVALDGLEQLARAFNGARFDPHLTVRHDVVHRIPRIERRLEDLHLLPRDAGPAQAADQFLALPAEHAADDDFNPALNGLSDDVHKSRA